jgi:hypothetical protein
MAILGSTLDWVRIAINEKASANAGLKVSSEFLRLTHLIE